ncbi:MAG: cytochrome c biogenesis protein CcsA [Magnetococcales bacterium]|nr:cytochrome c biogenesis protein CcsA [Magnetococcales bacterium]
MTEYLFWAAVGGYGIGAALVILNHLRGSYHPAVIPWWLVAGGWLAQVGIIVPQVAESQGQMPFNLSISLEWLALVLGFLYLAGWRLRRQEARSVGVLLLPLMLILLLVSQLLPSQEVPLREMVDPWLVSHMVLSMVAYGILSVAAILALLSAFQEHALRTKHLGRMFTMLPPLDAVEEVLFFSVRLGFFLLTLSILTGAVFSKQFLGVYFAFSHKVIFSWATWLVFGSLLLGRHYQGWRGGRAVRFTLSGYGFLALAWLGVKFVTEFVLGGSGLN